MEKRTEWKDYPLEAPATQIVLKRFGDDNSEFKWSQKKNVFSRTDGDFSIWLLVRVLEAKRAQSLIRVLRKFLLLNGTTIIQKQQKLIWLKFGYGTKSKMVDLDK